MVKVIKGTNGLDVLYGTAKDDEIYGLKGDDFITGNGGDDYIDGGDGDDDLLEGSAGNDVIHGGAGYDNIIGGKGDDTLYADANKTDGSDDLDGGAGDDILYGSTNASKDTLANCTLYGDDGDDTFYVLTKATEVDAGSGDDLIYAGMGKPMKVSYVSGFDGGDGVDTISFAMAKSGVVAELSYFDLYDADGNKVENGGAAAGDDGYRNIENLVGSKYADDLWGGEEVNEIAGSKGGDFLDGLGAKDVLTGGKGGDTFHFYAADHSAVGKADVVTDFKSGEGDRIDLSDIDADTEVVGDQDFAFIGKRGFGGTAGELRFADGLLTGDVDGDGRADFAIDIAVRSMNSGDFLL